MEYLSPWHRAIAAIAGAKVAIGLLLYGAAFASLEGPPGAREIRFVAFITVFAVGAALLLTAGRRDLRAAVLGIIFALTAAVFSDTAVVVASVAHPSVARLARPLFALQVDAFTGYFLWYFAREFPRSFPFGPRRRIPEAGMRAAGVVGVALFALNLGAYLASLAGFEATSRMLGIFGRQQPNGLYWPIQYGLALAGLTTLMWKSRRVAIADRRRVALLIGGIVVGTGPSVAWTLLATMSPAFRHVLPLSRAAWIVYPTLLATPLLTAYAVLVHQALNVRLIIRRAIQYAMARYTVLTLAAVPVAVLVAHVYRQRNQPLSMVVGGSTGMVVLAMVLLAVVAAQGRRTAMDRIDRRFFREQYDARHILADLTDSMSGASSHSQVADRLRDGIERALHPESIDVLLLDLEGNYFSTSGRTPGLDGRSSLIALLSSSVLRVDLENDDGPTRDLPEDDRAWLTDANARLIFAMRTHDHEIVGILVLADKKSELPYSGEDVEMLTTLATTAAMALAGLKSPIRVGTLADVGSSARAVAASVCVSCGLVESSFASTCTRCASMLAPSPIPRTIGGKYQLVERIGEGGMGVVFRGIDVRLGRSVAIKTLPRMEVTRAARLRREARAMAAISHRNLAMIHGVETWLGAPILIVEHLSGDSLANRIARGALSCGDALGLGIQLADVVHALHGASILHRDIKPANIAFTADGTPKLLDFGLARLLDQAEGWKSAERRRGLPLELSALPETADATTSFTTEGHIAGTPAYLSPEAIAGDEPDPSFDLWSLSIVLFEALSGVNPAKGVSVADTLRRISAGALIRLQDALPHADPELGYFFERAFSPQPARRFRSGAELRTALEELSHRHLARAG